MAYKHLVQFVVVIIAAVSILGCALTDTNNGDLAESVAESTQKVASILEIKVLDKHPTNECMNEYFDVFIDVFGVFVVSTSSAPLDYVLHSANVLAQYIDNDADGVADDPAVLDILVKGSYVVPVWAEKDRENFKGCEVSMAASMYYDNDIWALGGIEAAGTWDTNLEEVWHVVSRGWYEAYPDYFGEDESRILDAMDAARGGKFKESPSEYPTTAWYTYVDSSCSYGCQMHEYFYWILMANMGALDPSITNMCEQIQREWRVCNKEQLEKVDVLAFDLLNNQGFNLPTRIPDGNYQPLIMN